jgi:anaerobic selenocysteine-containing dehydrogenase
MSNAFVHGGFVQWPDFTYGKYLIAIGGTFGPNHAGSDGGVDYVVDAVQRGMKIVVVDPRQSPDSQLGEWVPIRPGTELPYLLAIANVILHEIGTIDQWFVKNRTTGPYLIGPDGYFKRDKATNKPQVRSAAGSTVKTFDDPTIKDLALEGKFKLMASRFAQPSFAQGWDEAIHTRMGCADYDDIRREHPAAWQRACGGGPDRQHDQHQWFHIPAAACCRLHRSWSDRTPRWSRCVLARHGNQPIDRCGRRSGWQHPFIRSSYAQTGCGWSGHPRSDS